MTTWTAADAKAKLSEVIALAQSQSLSGRFMRGCRVFGA